MAGTFPVDECYIQDIDDADRMNADSSRDVAGVIQDLYEYVDEGLRENTEDLRKTERALNRFITSSITAVRNEISTVVTDLQIYIQNQLTDIRTHLLMIDIPGSPPTGGSSVTNQTGDTFITNETNLTNPGNPFSGLVPVPGVDGPADIGSPSPFLPGNPTGGITSNGIVPNRTPTGGTTGGPATGPGSATTGAPGNPCVPCQVQVTTIPGAEGQPTIQLTINITVMPAPVQVINNPPPNVNVDNDFDLRGISGGRGDSDTFPMGLGRAALDVPIDIQLADNRPVEIEAEGTA